MRRNPVAVATVYPRASGGTDSGGRNFDCDDGLSPRERGNRVAVGDAGSIGGSIPARAGEPRDASPLTNTSTVYPRASGGTEVPDHSSSITEGLSPRERGNHGVASMPIAGAGSIPARAGEPSPLLARRPFRWVYPRASGGTPANPSPSGDVFGLSPRERGNRNIASGEDVEPGSIPARAGEPPPPPASLALPGVYPRASGGTVWDNDVFLGPYGLSPRERGNRKGYPRGTVSLRSIPARAGEP